MPENEASQSLRPSRSLWPAWSGYLCQRGLDRAAAEIFELAGPLAVIGAQLLYLGQPLLRQALPETHLQALALLFEDQNELKQFAHYLREAGSP